MSSTVLKLPRGRRAILSFLSIAQAACGNVDRDPLFVPIEQSLLDAARADENLDTFVDLMGVAQASTILAQDAQMTVFAPTDAAFSALPTQTLEALRKQPRTLRDILLFHVVPGRRKLSLVQISGALGTVQGSTLSVGLDGDNILLRGSDRSTAHVISDTSVESFNGLLNTIDGVLMP